MTEIATFEDARQALARSGVVVEKASEPKLWRVGGVETLDKGGVIARARALPRPPQTTHLALATIRTDGGTQARATLDTDRMFAYLDDMIDGALFPPIVVYYDGAGYWLADGFHRVEAAQRWHRNGGGPATIATEIRSGTRRDAVLHAVGANAEHGLRRSRDDIRRAIEVLLRDPEWQQWSDSEIARRVRVDHKTVGAHRKRLEDTGEIPRSETRKTADGRTMQTAPIRQANTARGTPPLPDRVAPGTVHPLIDAAMSPPPPPPLVETLERTGRLPEDVAVARPADAPRARGQQPARAEPRWTKPRHEPIVPSVLFFPDQRHLYRLPAPIRLPLVYGTPTTVRSSQEVPNTPPMGPGQRLTFPQTHVWCVRDDTAWKQVQAQHATLQQALDQLADVLRSLGRYDRNLAAAGGFPGAPNPLTPTVISASDPDADGGYLFAAFGTVPRLTRELITRHTAKMVAVHTSYGDHLSSQSHYMNCPDDAAWARVEAAREHVVAAKTAFDGLLRDLGTYHDALRDGRYDHPSALPIDLEQVRRVARHVLATQLVRLAAADLAVIDLADVPIDEAIAGHEAQALIASPAYAQAVAALMPELEQERTA